MNRAQSTSSLVKINNGHTGLKVLTIQTLFENYVPEWMGRYKVVFLLLTATKRDGVGQMDLMLDVKVV